MNEKIPRSPFSTPLSGAAKETELRLRGIFQWKNRRPPLPLLALMAAAVLLCGNLVSCQVRGAEPPAAASGSPAQSGSASDALADEEARWMLYQEKALPKLLEQCGSYNPEWPDSGGLLLTERGEQLNLMLGYYAASGHTGGDYNLLLGTFDQEGNPVDFYELVGDAGLYSTWEDLDGLHLVCANTVTWQGWESGGAPMHFRFDGRTLEQADQIPPSYMSAPAMPQRLSEWDGLDCKYLPIPGAVEVYRRTPGWDNLSSQQQGTPQWEYQGTVPLTTAQADPVPAAVRDAAREYIARADWEGVPTAGAPILRLEPMAQWNDFSQLALCSAWKDLENLTLSAWDLDFGDPANAFYMNGNTHLLFLRDGDTFTFLTTFYDYPLEGAPEQDLLAGLSPYNWYAVEALYNTGYLTARPRLADIFTKVPAPAQAWKLAEEYLEREGLELRITAMEPRLFCVEEPHWMGVYALESSKNGVNQPTQLAFFKLSSFRQFEICVYMLPEAETEDVEKQARAAAHGLVDYDVALWDLQYPDFPTAYGPGNYDGVFTSQGTVDNGDTWTEYGDRYEARFRSGGWNGRFCLSLDTTRRLPTTRGTKLGDSLARVRALYPELRDTPYPGLEGDYLWYCAGQPETHASLIFFFDGGAVSRLMLNAPLAGSAQPAGV